MAIFLTLLSLIPWYAIGVFPTGYLVARRAGIDITSKGSGNVGATNVARVLGKKAGLATLLGDVLKGILAVGLASLITSAPEYRSYAAVAVVAGHCFSFPPYLKGGKGVATALGAMIVLSLLHTLCGAAMFAILFYLKRIVSVASICAAFTVPLAALATGAPDEVAGAFSVIALIVVARHYPNIKRIIEGTEPISTFGKTNTN